MALIPELKEHISKGSPESKGVLTKAANKMSEAQQRDFLASLQLGDAEFQLAVAPYMPKGSTIDPSRARLKAFPKEAGVGPEGAGIKGMSTGNIKDPENPNLRQRYKGYELEVEPNTVTALEAVNANPRVFAHEYRHFEDTDANMERLNRVQDIMTSQNRDDLAENVRLLADLLHTEAAFGLSSEDDDPARYAAMYNAAREATDEELAGYTEELLQHPNVLRFMKHGSFKRRYPNMARGNYFDRAVEMPEGFRAGGRTRLI